MKRYLYAVAFSALAVQLAFAEEKEGVRVEIVPHIVENRSVGRSSGKLLTPVDKDMSLKAAVKNVSMKDAPEGSIDYVILVKRWTASEQERIARYSGSQKLPPLRPAQQVEIDVGKYHIGGHSHGTSSRHEDKLAGWKVTVTQGSRVVEFHTPTTFDALNGKATPSK
jgi:hypothetical protein